MGQTILIVEDDKDLRENICSILQNEGFQTTEAQNGTQALDKLLPSVSLVILDIMMPGISGIETCQQIRSFSYVPILFLTARSSESNKAQGLYAGGDDYLTKPFSYIELVARVRALLRRNECYHYQKPDSTPTETREQLQRHDIILTVNPPQVTVRGILTELTDTEYQLLYLFLKKLLFISKNSSISFKNCNNCALLSNSSLDLGNSIFLNSFLKISKSFNNSLQSFISLIFSETHNVKSDISFICSTGMLNLSK